MNLPNKLSLSRICMIPFFVAFALMDATWAQLVALAIFILASLTDMLDGKIARARNLVTNFGKFIDPIADKLLTMAAFVVFVQQGRMPGWVCILILAREFAVSGFRLVAADAGVVIAAGMLGKIKTVSQMIAIMLLMLTPVTRPATGIMVTLGNVVMYFALFMTVWSGIDYIAKNFHLIKDM